MPGEYENYIRWIGNVGCLTVLGEPWWWREGQVWVGFNYFWTFRLKTFKLLFVFHGLVAGMTPIPGASPIVIFGESHGPVPDRR